MSKPRKWKFSIYQPELWEPAFPDSQEGPVMVSFRELVPEIKDTGYLTHSLFYYPAKFIPQVPHFCLRTYTKVGDWVLDPFAGSGTVGLEAVLMNRHAILIDINPLLNYLAPIKILYAHRALDIRLLQELINTMFEDSSFSYRPAWKNLEYWYEPEILQVLCQWWGWVKSLGESPYRPILEIALLKVSKNFSNAEHKAPKLFRSKAKQQFLREVLSGDWKGSMQRLFYETAIDAYYRLAQLAHLRAKGAGMVLYQGGVDSADPRTFDKLAVPPGQVQAIITSPPYLQAQEYIRTAKLELYWLGYSQEEIQEVSRLEIPYRPAKEKLSTPSLDDLRKRILRQDLSKILDSYFYYTVSAIENAARLLAPKGVLCIFVGSPKIDGIEVETWRIFMEYFVDRGFQKEALFQDKIKGRQLFKRRKNKNPEGMDSEFLLIMRKK